MSENHDKRGERSYEEDRVSLGSPEPDLSQPPVQDGEGDDPDWRPDGADDRTDRDDHSETQSPSPEDGEYPAVPTQKRSMVGQQRQTAHAYPVVSGPAPSQQPLQSGPVEKPPKAKRRPGRPRGTTGETSVVQNTPVAGDDVVPVPAPTHPPTPLVRKKSEPGKGLPKSSVAWVNGQLETHKVETRKIMRGLSDRIEDSSATAESCRQEVQTVLERLDAIEGMVKELLVKRREIRAGSYDTGSSSDEETPMRRSGNKCKSRSPIALNAAKHRRNDQYGTASELDADVPAQNSQTASTRDAPPLAHNPGSVRAASRNNAPPVPLEQCLSDAPRQSMHAREDSFPPPFHPTTSHPPQIHSAPPRRVENNASSSHAPMQASSSHTAGNATASSSHSRQYEPSGRSDAGEASSSAWNPADPGLRGHQGQRGSERGRGCGGERGGRGGRGGRGTPNAKGKGRDHGQAQDVLLPPPFDPEPETADVEVGPLTILHPRTCDTTCDTILNFIQMIERAATRGDPPVPKPFWVGATDAGGYVVACFRGRNYQSVTENARDFADAWNRWACGTQYSNTWAEDNSSSTSADDVPHSDLNTSSALKNGRKISVRSWNVAGKLAIGLSQPAWVTELEKYDINIFQETHLYPSQEDTLPIPADYEIFAKSREP
ncbi:hypothetical protein C8R43DRAFT_1121447 [Mycena crocata]|nr:hypothetical protein C8R43DRAFT_1121447 [Mycena crocata]